MLDCKTIQEQTSECKLEKQQICTGGKIICLCVLTYFTHFLPESNSTFVIRGGKPCFSKWAGEIGTCQWVCDHIALERRRGGNCAHKNRNIECKLLVFAPRSRTSHRTLNKHWIDLLLLKPHLLGPLGNETAWGCALLFLKSRKYTCSCTHTHTHTALDSVYLSWIQWFWVLQGLLFLFFPTSHSTS